MRRDPIGKSGAYASDAASRSAVSAVPAEWSGVEAGLDGRFDRSVVEAGRLRAMAVSRLVDS